MTASRKYTLKITSKANAPKPAKPPAEESMAHKFRSRVDAFKAIEEIHKADIKALEKLLQAGPPPDPKAPWLKGKQVVALSNELRDMKFGFRQNAVKAPPAFGKTVLQVYKILSLVNAAKGADRQIIWVAPNHPLIEKNIGELAIHAKHLLPLVRIYSGQTKDEIPNNCILCCTPVMFVRLMEKNNGYPDIRLSYSTAVISDEKHILVTILRHGAYEVFDKFDISETGYTATPYLADGRNVFEIAYEGREPSFKMGYREAVSDGLLCDTAQSIVRVTYKISERERTKLEATVRKLAPGATNAQVRTFMNRVIRRKEMRLREDAMVNAWASTVNKYNGESLFLKKTIVFCRSVKSAQRTAMKYNKRWAASHPKGGQAIAGFITSDMTPKEQQDIRAAHKRGDILVLVNVRCLAIGHDDVQIKLVEVLCGTISLPLMAQELGRGSRIDPDDPTKMLYARQWWNPELDRNSVLLTEALEGGKPVLQHNFQPSQGIRKPPVEQMASTDPSVELTLITGELELEVITRMNLASSGALLPPVSGNNYVTARRFCEIFEAYSEKTNHPTLRIAVDKLLAKLIAQYPEDSLLGEEFRTAEGVTIIMAGTDEGNLWHFSYPEFYQFFTNMYGTEYGTSKIDLDDVLEPNNFVYWEAAVPAMIKSDSKTRKKDLEVVAELKARLEEEYNDAQETLPQKRRYKGVFRTSLGIDVRLTGPEGTLIIKDDQVNAYLAEHCPNAVRWQVMEDIIHRLVLRENFGTGPYIGIEDAGRLIRNMAMSMAVNPFLERDLKYIIQSLIDFSREVNIAHRPAESSFGVCIIKEDIKADEFTVNVGDLKYYFLKRAQELMEEKLAKFENSVPLKHRLLPAEANHKDGVLTDAEIPPPDEFWLANVRKHHPQYEKDFYEWWKQDYIRTLTSSPAQFFYPIEQRMTDRWLVEFMKNFGYSKGKVYELGYNIITAYVYALNAVCERLPDSQKTADNTITVYMYRNPQAPDRPPYNYVHVMENYVFYAIANGRYYKGREQINLEDIPVLDLDRAISFKCVRSGKEDSYYVNLQEFLYNLKNYSHCFEYSRSLHHQHQNQTPGMVHPETLFEKAGASITLKPSLVAAFRSKVEAVLTAQYMQEERGDYGPVPISARLKPENIRLYATAFLRFLTSDEDDLRSGISGVWPVMSVAELVGYLRREGQLVLAELDNSLTDEQLCDLSRLDQKQMAARLALDLEVNPHAGVPLQDPHFRWANRQTKKDPTYVMHRRLYRAIENDDPDRIRLILGGYPELAGRILEEYGMIPIFYAAHRGRYECYMALFEHIYKSLESAYRGLDNARDKLRKRVLQEFCTYDRNGLNILHHAVNPDVDASGPDAGEFIVIHLIEIVGVPADIHSTSKNIPILSRMIGSSMTTGQQNCILHPRTYAYIEALGPDYMSGKKCLLGDINAKHETINTETWDNLPASVRKALEARKPPKGKRGWQQE